ncbi:MAG: hypothetical protein ABL893_13865, partial [Hyphomicrobium sp.]
MDFKGNFLGYTGYTLDFGNIAPGPEGFQSSSTLTAQATIGKTMVGVPWVGGGFGFEGNQNNQVILNLFGYAVGQGVNANINLSVLTTKGLNLLGYDSSSQNVLETYQMGVMTGAGFQLFGLGLQGTSFFGFGIDTVNGVTRTATTSTTNVGGSIILGPGVQLKDQFQFYYNDVNGPFNSGLRNFDVAGLQGGTAANGNDQRGFQSADQFDPFTAYGASSLDQSTNFGTDPFNSATVYPGAGNGWSGDAWDVPGTSLSFGSGSGGSSSSYDLFDVFGGQGVYDTGSINQLTTYGTDPSNAWASASDWSSDPVMGAGFDWTATDVAGVGFDSNSDYYSGGYTSDATQSYT